ncbi:hypothetical protein LJR164_000732 [Phenylobacterium sp. LjRoot164]|uniref:hypothetical protein n=1 Tax=unclassified Phenylobacterium TaxID=2640670 RepID=UPI003ED0BF57
MSSNPKTAEATQLICTRDPRYPGTPWVTIWKGQAAFILRRFDTREQAMQAARDVALGPPSMNGDFASFPAREPYPSNGGDLLAGAVESADRALAAIFAEAGRW